MRNMQLLKANGWRGFAMMLVVCGLALFLSGCRNAIGPQDMPVNEVGTGTLTLTIGRQGVVRTIAPDISMDDFARFRLDFAVAEECDSGNDDFYEIWEDDVTYGTIPLDFGIWELTVTAYMDIGDKDDDEEEENLVAIAAGSLRIDMSRGGEIFGNVALAPIPEGQGTFTWDICFVGASINFARMYVRRVDLNPSVYWGTRYIVGGQPLFDSDSVYLDAGQYRVVLTLENNRNLRTELMTILHIYRDMESVFEVEITDEHFGVTLLEHFLGAWDGLSWIFPARGISATTFGVLDIAGVNEDNFDAVVDWFNRLSRIGPVPTNLAGLRSLTDAALVGVASEDEAFLDAAGNFTNRAHARAAILGRPMNGTNATISWGADNRAVVRIGGYEITFTNAVPPTFPHYTMLTVAARLGWIRDHAQSHNYYVVEITDENITPAQAALPTGLTGITITFRSSVEMQTVGLSTDGSGPLFTVGSGVTLILDENVTLRGRSENTSHLVRVNSGGTFIMNEGSIVTGNQNTTATVENGGGGVRVNNGGVFILDGGEVSGNSTTNTSAVGNGGGVHVASGGRFDMLDGTIYGNTGQDGGGVFVAAATTTWPSAPAGIFRISDGIIRGSEAEAGVRNTARGNGATLLNSGTAQRGTFDDDGTFGSLGTLGSTDNLPIHVVEGNLQERFFIRHISAGSEHTAAVTEDGLLWAWGNNASGRLGDGTTTNRFVPVRIGTDSNWDYVSAGDSHTVALRTDGTLWAWGSNVSGQLGDATIVSASNTPQRIGTFTDWVAVSAGISYTVGIRTGGTLWVWGLNTSGRLGTGDTTTLWFPERIMPETDWAFVSAGSAHTVAISTDGELWAWGLNSFGQVGDNTTTTRLVPVQIGTSTEWKSVSTGDSHTVGIKTDGTLWAWGNNGSGRLGDNTTTTRLAPVQIGTSTEWESVSAGGTHTVAAMEDGTIWAWGANTSGQLGFTGGAQWVPMQVGTATSWTAISAGGSHSAAIGTGDSLWVWGNNGLGRLGDGTTTTRWTPVHIR
ncbi:MAG: hypothetical protein FWB78_01745 [Treponema sp.]|nr:hypothetical protein [Treponema sp.]